MVGTDAGYNISEEVKKDMVDYLIKFQTRTGKVEEILVELTEKSAETYNCYAKLYAEKK